MDVIQQLKVLHTHNIIFRDGFVRNSNFKNRNIHQSIFSIRYLNQELFL